MQKNSVCFVCESEKEREDGVIDEEGGAGNETSAVGD